MKEESSITPWESGRRTTCQSMVCSDVAVAQALAAPKGANEGPPELPPKRDAPTQLVEQPDVVEAPAEVSTRTGVTCGMMPEMLPPCTHLCPHSDSDEVTAKARRLDAGSDAVDAAPVPFGLEAPTGEEVPFWQGAWCGSLQGQWGHLAAQNPLATHLAGKEAEQASQAEEAAGLTGEVEAPIATEVPMPATFSSWQHSGTHMLPVPSGTIAGPTPQSDCLGASDGLDKSVGSCREAFGAGCTGAECGVAAVDALVHPLVTEATASVGMAPEAPWAGDAPTEVVERSDSHKAAAKAFQASDAADMSDVEAPTAAKVPLPDAFTARQNPRTRQLLVPIDTVAADQVQSSPPAGHLGTGSGMVVESAGSCYKVFFTRTAHKKRRTWECGVLRINEAKAHLYTEEGKHLHLGKVLRTKEKLAPGAELKVAPFLIEVESEIPVEDFLSGRAFAVTGGENIVVAESKKRPARSLLGGVANGSDQGVPTSLQLPSAPPGALLLGSNSDGHPVFLEPALSQRLRPHQKDGVLFMFRHILAGGGCILADSMGLGKTLQALCAIWVALSKPAGRPLSHKAAVVCPSSLCGNWEAEVTHWLGPWRVRPAVVQGGSYAVTALRDLQRFLAAGGPAASDGRLLIISYDQLRQHAELLDGAVDLLVFDEGHRLKSAGASTTQRIGAMRCPRRVLLTGTPLQNNLEEFWSCCSFVQPKLLPPLGTFQRIFKQPIERAQDASASAREVALGGSRSAELTRLTSAIILRRGPEILEALLPPRTELLLTVPLTPAQVTVYRALCELGEPGKAGGRHLHLLILLRQLCNTPEDLREHCGRSLVGSGRGLWPGAAARLGQQGCPHDGSGEESEDGGCALPPRQCGAPAQDFMQACRTAFAQAPADAWTSEARPPKLAFLESILRWIGDSAPDDGVVVVSNFITTLERCQEICQSLGFVTFALMGSTKVHKRVGLVSAFNRVRGRRAFLLSTRAGGVGLNIVGGNRLVMLEPDWNPAVDLQAMGRVWREGQTKPVFIYRLAMHGTLEENILQRQARKQGLATVMVDSAQAEDMQVGDWAELRQVYLLAGYTSSGRPISSGGQEPEREGLFQGAGLCGTAARSRLLSVRLVATTRSPESGSPEDAARPAPDRAELATSNSASEGAGDSAQPDPAGGQPGGAVSSWASEGGGGRWDRYLEQPSPGRLGAASSAGPASKAPRTF